MNASMTMALDIKTVLSGIMNVTGDYPAVTESPWTSLISDIQSALVDGLIRMNSRPAAAITIRARAQRSLWRHVPQCDAICAGR